MKRTGDGHCCGTRRRAAGGFKSSPLNGEVNFVSLFVASRKFPPVTQTPRYRYNHADVGAPLARARTGTDAGKEKAAVESVRVAPRRTVSLRVTTCSLYASFLIKDSGKRGATIAQQPGSTAVSRAAVSYRLDLSLARSLAAVPVPLGEWNYFDKSDAFAAIQYISGICGRERVA